MKYWGISKEDKNGILEHWGVKGMKWKKRRGKKSSKVSWTFGEPQLEGEDQPNSVHNWKARIATTANLQRFMGGSNRLNNSKSVKPDEGDRNFRSGKQGHAQDYGREYWNLVRADDSEKRRKKKG